MLKLGNLLNRFYFTFVAMSSQPLIHPTAIIDAGAVIGPGTRIWHFTHVMPTSTIGKECNLGQNVFIDNNVMIGDHVKIQNNVSVYNGVKLEDDVFIGPSAVFTNVINPRSFIERKNEFKPTLVRLGATIGANATILCGITIGKYAMIGAGAVVTKDVHDYAVVVGNPGRQKGWISQAGAPLSLTAENMAMCSITGVRYILDGAQLHQINQGE